MVIRHRPPPQNAGAAADHGRSGGGSWCESCGIRPSRGFGKAERRASCCRRARGVTTRQRGATVLFLGVRPRIATGFAHRFHSAVSSVVTLRILADFGFSGPALCW